MLPIILREKCQAVAVVSVDKNKEQRRLSDELKKDLKQICKDFDILPFYINILHGHNRKSFQK